MVHQVTTREAQEHLTELIDAAVSGETVLITQDGGQTVQLMPLAAPVKGRPRFGSGKGLMVMADDFDEPITEFESYTQ